MSEKKVLSEMTLGERIKVLRRLHGWHIERLSVKTGLRVNRLAEIESGCDIPYAYEIVRIADALEVSLAFIAGRVR
jgi:transcriptional regulator with XRE-family HTH domain